MTVAEDTIAVLRREVHVRLQDSPSVEDDVARRIIRETVDAWERRATRGGARPLANPGRTVARLEASVLGYGPLTRLVAPGAGIEEVLGTGADLTYLDRSGRICTPDDPTTEDELRAAVSRLLLETGRSVDAATPIVHAQVLDGHGRLSVVVPPISERFSFGLRLYTANHATLESLVADDTLSLPAAQLLHACMATPGVGTLVSGMPGAGKTTLSSALLRATPHTRRIISCEETRELSAPLANGLYLQTRPAQGAGADRLSEISLRQLFLDALRMRPELIVVGEVRGPEAYDLLKAGNSGCGLLCTVHANSARDALHSLTTTALMAGENVHAGVVRRAFTGIFHLVVHLDRGIHRLPDGTDRLLHQVVEISGIPPLQGSELDFTMEPLFVRDQLGAPLRWTGAPPPEPLRGRLERTADGWGTRLTDLLEATA